MNKIILAIVFSVCFAAVAKEVEISYNSGTSDDSEAIEAVARKGTCTRYTGSFPKEVTPKVLDLEGCVSSKNKIVLKSVCNAKNEEKLFGNTSRGFQVEFIYRELVLGCDDRGVGLNITVP